MILTIAALTIAMAPPVQRPRAVETGAAPPVEADAAATEPEPAAPTAEPTPPRPDETVATEPTGEPTPEPAALPPAATPAPKGEMVHVAEGNKQSHAPYYDGGDLDALRKRNHLKAMPAEDTRKVRWRCFIADPLCGFNVEVQAMGAYAGRFKQGDVRTANARKWSSGRAQYDVWVNIPVASENVGRTRYTRMTLGPKAGAMFSDNGDTWGNVGLVGRYWFGRGRWAPHLEFTSALAFKIAHRWTIDPPAGYKSGEYAMQRGPVGITGDIGIGFGGFGAIVFGGQYDSPLARTDVPGDYHTAAAGMLYVGFRGNILWGGPAVAAVAAHGLTQRYSPDRK